MRVRSRWTKRRGRRVLRLRPIILSTPQIIRDTHTRTRPMRGLLPMATPPSQLSFFPDEWPDGLSYRENYISEEEAKRLVQKVDAARWRTDLKRRVQDYGYRYDYITRQARRDDYLGPLPALFQKLAERLAFERHFQTVPDQVIVNEYQPGQGISAHIDCQPCFGETIASVSLLSACVMRFASQNDSQQMDLHLQPASLLVLKDDARLLWSHAIQPRKSDVIEGQRHHRSRRISLTFRTMKFKTP